MVSRLNHLLDGTPHVPLDPLGDAFFGAVPDGLLLSHLINRIDEDALDVRALNTVDLEPLGATPLTDAQRLQNHTLMINAATSIACGVPSLHPQQLLHAPDHKQVALAQLWSLISHSLLSKINVRDHPEFFQLAADNEKAMAVARLPPEELMRRWLNHHIAAYCESHPADAAELAVENSWVGRGPQFTVNNLHEDLEDGTALAIVMHQVLLPTLPLVPAAAGAASGDTCEVLPLRQDMLAAGPAATSIEDSFPGFWDAEDRAELVAALVQRAGPERVFQVTAEDIGKPRPRMLAGLVASLMDSCPGLQPKHLQVEEDEEEKGEERVFRMWATSLGLDLQVSDLREDCRSGLVLLRVEDHLHPGIVDWSRVNMKPRSIFERTENCNLAVEMAVKLGAKVVGIQGKDVAEGQPKLTLAIWWQLMRKDVMQFFESLGIDAAHILRWANLRVASTGSKLRMSRFSDPMLASGAFLLQLLHAVDPAAVELSMVLEGTEADPLSAQQRRMNAMYVISCAHKMGCRVFLGPQHIVQVDPKQILLLIAAAMAVDMRRGGMDKQAILEEVAAAAQPDVLSVIVDEGDEVDEGLGLQPPPAPQRRGWFGRLRARLAAAFRRALAALGGTGGGRLRSPSVPATRPQERPIQGEPKGAAGKARPRLPPPGHQKDIETGETSLLSVGAVAEASASVSAASRPSSAPRATPPPEREESSDPRQQLAATMMASAMPPGGSHRKLTSRSSCGTPRGGEFSRKASLNTAAL